jgi:hypothetical protein
MKSERPPGRVVYVGLRVYDPETRRMKNCRGLTIRFEKFAPKEVYDIIVKAALEQVPTARIVHQKESTDGKE